MNTIITTPKSIISTTYWKKHLRNVSTMIPPAPETMFTTGNGSSEAHHHHFHYYGFETLEQFHTPTTMKLVFGLILLLLFLWTRYRRQEQFKKWQQTIPNYNEIPDTILHHMATKQELKELNGTIDIAIIGSGVGALSCGVILSRCGYKVGIFEQHYTIGGSTHMYKDHGYEFDVGVHYVGGQMNNTRTSIFRWMFDILTDGKLVWSRIAEIYDVVYNSSTGERIEFTGDTKWNRQTLLLHFPTLQSSALDLYYTKCKHARTVANIAFVVKCFPPIITKFIWKYLGFNTLYRNSCLRTTLSVMKECGIPDDAIGAICYSYGDYGTVPSDSPFFMQAFMENHYDGGAFFPKGGSKSIAKTMVAAIQRRGGKVFANCPVEKILTERRHHYHDDGFRLSMFQKDKNKYKAVGIRVRGIGIMTKKGVISGAGFTRTFVPTSSSSEDTTLSSSSSSSLQPLVELAASQEQLSLTCHHHDNVDLPIPSQELTSFRPSPAFFYLFIGLDGSDEELHLPGQNIWHVRDWDHSTSMNDLLYHTSSVDDAIHQVPPLVFLSNESAKDPDYTIRHPGKATVTMVAWTDPQWFQEWRNKKSMTTTTMTDSGTKTTKTTTTRGKHYDEVKETMKESLLAVLYHHFPLTKGRVEFAEMGTPLSAEKYLGRSSGGAIYNLDHNVQRFDTLEAQLALHPQTTIHHLYQTGQDVVAVSIEGAAISGFITAARVSPLALTVYSLPGAMALQSWLHWGNATTAEGSSTSTTVTTIKKV